MSECPELFPEDDPNLTSLPTVEDLTNRARDARLDTRKRRQLIGLFYDDMCALSTHTRPTRA